MRLAAGGGAVVEPSSEATRGDLGLPAAPLPFADRNGDAVRAAGVPVRDGGLLRLMAGLSQEEKKSSPGSLVGVLVPVPSLYSAESSMITESGFLGMSAMHSVLCMAAHFLVSSSTLRANSSLYLLAALLVYLTLGSLLARAAEPP